MLIYNFSIKNKEALTEKEISELTIMRLATAYHSASKLCQNGWSVACSNNKLIFRNPKIMTLPETLQHLNNLNMSSEPLEYSSDDDEDDDFDDDDWDEETETDEWGNEISDDENWDEETETDEWGNEIDPDLETDDWLENGNSWDDENEDD